MREVLLLSQILQTRSRSTKTWSHIVTVIQQVSINDRNPIQSTGCLTHYLHHFSILPLIRGKGF